jgi:ABC-type sugar transport system ATPase subunit
VWTALRHSPKSARILVAKGGRIVTEFPAGGATERDIMFAAVY